MAEYIDLDKAKEKVKSIEIVLSVHGYDMSMDFLRDFLDNCDAIDLEDSELTFDPVCGDWVCAVCSYHTMEHGKFCPNCGSKIVKGDKK